MSAQLGTFQFDLWRGNIPPAVKPQVEMIFTPGQTVAAARILPGQSTSGEFQGVVFGDWSSAHTLADSYRSIIGTVVTIQFEGVDYGSVLVNDVTVEEVKKLARVKGVHPDGTAFSEAPGARVTSRWRITRLS